MRDLKLPTIFEKMSSKFQALGQKVTLLKLLISWFAVSIFLSISIILKFQFPSFPWIVNLNIAFYFVEYYVIPILCFLRLAPFFCPSEMQVKSKKWRRFVLLPISFFLVFLSWIYLTIAFRILPDYATSAIPISLAIAIHFRFYKPQYRKKIVAIAMALLPLFLPYSFAYLGYFGLLNSARAIVYPSNQVAFISQAGMAITGNGFFIQSFVRANFGSSQDFAKFLISGAGACGETSMFEEKCYRDLVFETMKVGFPGEDHAFVEVRVNSSWKVIDPGYNMILVSRSSRATARINEVGTISYVTGNSNGIFVELTQEYVPTDTITIRVTEANNPISDASINLVHQLRYGASSYSTAIPGDGFSFHTDFNGTIVIRLGKIGEGAYNEEFEKTDPFYRIYVNGKPTDYKINSTGTGLTTFLNVDVSER